MKKKFFLFTLVLLTAFCVGAGLSACKKPPETANDGLTLNAASVENRFLLGETPDFTTLTGTVTENGVPRDVTYADLKVGAFATDQAGTFIVPVTYGSFTQNLTLTVEGIEFGVNAELVSFSIPDVLAEYANNIAAKPGNERSEFYDRTDGYYVGTDNPYILQSEIMIEKTVGKLAGGQMRYIGADVVEIKRANGSEVILAGSAEVAVDTTAGSFQFKAPAVGQTYTITVSLPGELEGYDLTATSFTHTVKIVEGYNVYTAAQLSVIDNKEHAYVASGYNRDDEWFAKRGTNDDLGDIWKEFKVAHDIPIGEEAKSIKAAILHGDIAVTKDDLPDAWFYTAGVAEGSLRNRADFHFGSEQGALYTRETAADQTFSLIGNYFQIDASALPVTVRKSDNTVVTQGSDNYVDPNASVFLFAFIPPYNVINTENGVNRYSHVKANLDIGKTVVKNINFFGNAQRNEETLNYGGLSLMASRVKRTDIQNVITTAFVTQFFFGADAYNYTVNPVAKLLDVKSYDSFGNMVNVRGSARLFIEHSELKGSGGPVVIVSDPFDGIAYFGDAPDIIYITPDGLEKSEAQLPTGGAAAWDYLMPEITVDKYSLDNIVTKVTGTEAWFNANGLKGSENSMVAEIKGLSGGLQQVSNVFKNNSLISNTYAFHTEEGAGENPPHFFNPKFFFMPHDLNSAPTAEGKLYLGTESQVTYIDEHNENIADKTDLTAANWSLTSSADTRRCIFSFDDPATVGGYIAGGYNGGAPVLKNVSTTDATMTGYPVYFNNTTFANAANQVITNPTYANDFKKLFAGDIINLYYKTATDKANIAIILEYYELP
jgi:hypothetical protein